MLFKDEFRFEKILKIHCDIQKELAKFRHSNIAVTSHSTTYTQTHTSGFSTLLKISHLHGEITALTLPDLHLQAIPTPQSPSDNPTYP